MSESRIEALERLLKQVDSFDLAAAPHPTQRSLIDEATSLLAPFLQNPERHQQQVGLVIQYSNLLVMHSVLSGIELFRLPLFRSWVQRRLQRTVLQRMKSQIEDAKDQILTSVEPGELKLDLLPIVSARTEADWKKQGFRLMMLQTRGVFQPTSGMQLRAISHQIEVTDPAGCQFIDAKPDSEMEIIGEREISITERGKLAYTDSSEAKLEASLEGGPAKLGSSFGYKQESNLEAEATMGEKLSHTSQVARVVSSAVGGAAMWRLLRTPSRTLLGTQKFAASVLIPANAKTLTVSLRLAAEIEGWGNASIPQQTQLVTVP